MTRSADQVRMNKAHQDSEAAERQRAEKSTTAVVEEPTNRGHVTVTPDAADPTSGLEDNARVAPEQPEQRTEPTPQKPPPVNLTKGDGKRAEIMGRYRTSRQADDDEARGNYEDLNAFTHGGLPPELVDADPDAAADAADIQRYADQNREPGEDVQLEPARQPAAQRVTVKVMGRDLDLTMEEIIAAAQKSLAGDNYLEDAKAQAREAAELLRQARGQVATPSGQNQTTTDDQQPQETEPENQGPDLADVVETMQIGSREDGAEKLAAYIDHRIAEVRREAATQPQRALADQRVAEELDRSNRAIAAFRKANPALFEGKTAEYVEIAIEKKLYDKYREDLEQNNITAEAMRQQLGREPNINDLARYHTWYRGNRPDAVRTMDRILEDAKTTVLDDNPAWNVAPQPTPATPRKIEVEVDRGGRRQTIQQQPSRAAAPSVPAPRGAPQADRTAVAQRMIAERAAKRGRIPVPAGA